MKKTVLSIMSAVMLCIPAFSQAPVIGTQAWAAQHSQQDRSGPVLSPLNGDDSLSTTYSNSACGLNYTMGSVRLGQRFSPLGLPQPAPINLVFPSCGTILKAYLYTEVLGVDSSINATLVNPASQSSTYSMTLIGSSQDVCWGMNGTHVWRSDVTASISGPGLYTISGLPVSTQNPAIDVEGATLVVIYQDPYASYTGSIILDDGCHTVAGGALHHTMTGFSACANSSYASNFMLIGDMQMPGYSISMNNASVTQPQWNWWNEITDTTSVTNGQSTCNFDLNGFGDCYTLAVAALYYQTGCQACTPATTALAASVNTVAATCGNNGSASVSVTGGSGNYTYYWAPGGQTTSTVSGLAAGTYTVYILDGSDCTSALATVSYNGPTLTLSASASSCNATGSASVVVNNGTGPYSYLWSPSGDTISNPGGLLPGYQHVTVTDQGSGCVLTDSVYLAPVAFTASVYSSPAQCSTATGMIGASVTSGNPPYTFLWYPLNDTSAQVSNVYPGTYTVVITDAAGCTLVDSVTVGNQSMWVYTYGGGNYACGDSAFLQAFCSDPAATFSWSPSASLINANTGSPVSFAAVTTTYTVTVTSPSCGTMTDSVTVSMGLSNPHNESICIVYVDTALNKNVVVWERNNSPLYGYYNIYRETSTANVYALIGTQPVSQYSTFTDMSSDPSLAAERYKLTTVDSCGIESDTSGHHRTIFLQTFPNVNGGFDLSWNAYEGFPVSTYSIYRGSSLSSLVLIDQVLGIYTSYTDPNPPAGQNYYFVEAVHPFGGCNPVRHAAGGPNVQEANETRSNISLADPNGIPSAGSLAQSLVLIPNPSSGNFQVSMKLGAAQTITISIYNSLGQEVLRQQAAAVAGTNTFDFSLAGYGSGIYSVQVTAAGGTATRRLVIE